MIELKDVIHYYLNCRVMAAPYGGQPNRYEEGVLVGVLGDVWEIKFNGWQSSAPVGIDKIKPILRRLEDIGNHEAIALTSLVVHQSEFLNPKVYRNVLGDLIVGWGDLIPIDGDDEFEYKYNASCERTWSAEQFNYLIKQRFDLFGLIETDQALDAKTINNEQSK